MSLSKQLLILISFMFLMIFSVNLALGISNIKAYLEGESQSHAQDTATSLGLSLSPHMKDTNDPIIKAMVAAIFDMGYYKEIRLVDASGEELISLRNDKNVEGVPGWFIDSLPMSPAIAESEITSGWILSGKVIVTINPAFGVSKLYGLVKTSFFYSLIAFVFSVALLLLILQYTLASLKRIAQLALQIADGHFKTIEILPSTIEVKNVALSMNIMSTKLEIVFADLNSKLAVMRESLLLNDFSGLYKKVVYDTDIKQLLMEHCPAYLILVKLDSLPELVKEYTSDSIDLLLKAFAGKITDMTEQYPEFIMKAYHFYGGEFVMLVKTNDVEAIESFAKSLSTDISELGEKYAKSDLMHIGIVPVNLVGTPKSQLFAATEAYEQARLIGPNSYYIRTNKNIARDIANWKTLVLDCIDNANYTLSYVGKTTSFQTGLIIMEEVITQVYDKNGEKVAIGLFVSIAEKITKIIKHDKAVIEKVLEYIVSNKIQHTIAVNLSSSAINNLEFCLWLEKLLKNNHIAVQQLVFSLSAYAVGKEIDAHAEFIYNLHRWGGRVMVKRFEAQFMSPDIVKKLKPDYIRLGREIGEGINHSRQKYEFVQAIRQMGMLLDIAVLAENVQSDNDYLALKEIGIFGASR